MDAGAPAARLAPDLAPSAHYTVSSAVRCKECHAPIVDEWRASAHAHAASAPLYALGRGQATSAAACDRCHAPFAGHTEADDPVPSEGVTCDVCHAVAAVDEARTGGAFTLKTEDNVKYGTLCDAAAHYFHKMGCSPLHDEGRFCAACHLLYQRTGSVEIPVFTEYEEWKQGPWADQKDCQGCHMPGRAGIAATGAKKRDEVAHHGDFGLDDGLRRRAVAMSVQLAATADGVRADVELHNEGAGHRVPTGMPGRQLVLALRTVASDGHVVDEKERVYQRALVDASDRPAPFWRAVRMAGDDRLGPREKRVETIELRGAPGAKLEARLVWRALDPRITAALGLPAAPLLPPAGELVARDAKGAVTVEILREARLPLPAAGRTAPRVTVAAPRPARGHR